MKRCKIVVILSFLLAGAISGLFALNTIESTLITNASLLLPDGSWQTDSFVLVKGSKIQKTGLMSQLQPGGIYDNHYDLKGKFLYPAFIDPLYKGFQVQEKARSPKKSASVPYGSRPETTDSFIRPSMAKRNYFITRSAVKRLKLDKIRSNKVMGSGFAFLNVLPGTGIIGGTTTVVSLVSNEPARAVLVPEQFMTVSLKPNRSHYPVTPAGIAAELKQLKVDSLYHEKVKKLQFFNAEERVNYKPELDILHAYFTQNKRFIITINNYSQQRIAEILTRDLGINPVLVGHPDIWRRPVAPGSDIILPLGFEPPDRSKYAQQGEKIKKEAKEKIYPQQLADFFKKHKNICLSAPGDNDYKTLFKNISALVKQGVAEADIVNALTLNPARLLGIDRFAGTIEAGKLAAITVFNKKIIEKDAVVQMMFLEDKIVEFKTPEKKEVNKNKKKKKKKKPARASSGNGSGGDR